MSLPAKTLFTGLMLASLLTGTLGWASSTGPRCQDLFLSPPTAKQQAISYAAQATGLVLGAANDVILTATGVRILPAGVSKWLPLFNEVANVSSSATRQSWLYEGLNKKIIDGIALGGISGQALQATAHQGPLAGALILGVNVGLTYWFPNKYFKPIMQSIPKLLPGKAKMFAQSGVGQGVIGISMIVVLERVLEHGQELALKIPHLLASTKSSGIERAPALASELKPEDAIAIALVASTLDGDPMNDRAAADELAKRTGYDRAQSTFFNHIEDLQLSAGVKLLLQSTRERSAPTEVR